MAGIGMRNDCLIWKCKESLDGSNCRNGNRYGMSETCSLGGYAGLRNLYTDCYHCSIGGAV